MDEKNTASTMIKFFSFVAAFALWIYISTIYNPVKTITITNVPVEIINSEGIKDTALILMPKQNFKVNITIKGNANIIYEVKASDFKLEVDLSKYAFKKGATKVPVDIIEAPRDVTILKESGTWVEVDVDNLVDKILPIEVALSGEPNRDVVFGKPQVTPSQITITGPETYVKQVDKLQVSCSFEEFQEQGTLKLPIEALDENGRRVTDITLSQVSGEVELPYDNIKSVPLNIKTSGTAGDDITIKSMEADITSVNISGSNEALAKVSAIDTEAIDLSAIKDSGTIEAKLILPKGINVVSGIYTTKVKFTVEKIISKSINLNIAIENLGSDLKCNLSDVKANVVVKGNEKIINELVADNFSCNVDCKDLAEGEYGLKINVSAKDDVSIVSINPETVKVTISK